MLEPIDLPCPICKVRPSHFCIAQKGGPCTVDNKFHEARISDAKAVNAWLARKAQQWERENDNQRAQEEGKS